MGIVLVFKLYRNFCFSNAYCIGIGIGLIMFCSTVLHLPGFTLYYSLYVWEYEHCTHSFPVCEMEGSDQINAFYGGHQFHLMDDPINLFNIR